MSSSYYYAFYQVKQRSKWEQRKVDQYTLEKMLKD
jgi:hypothetical protein